MAIHIDFKSYTGTRAGESHDHAQIVLALEGGMELEANGKGAKLDSTYGAFLAPGVSHSQAANGQNKFLVLNCDWRELDAPLAERLADRIFLRLSPAAQHLIGFAEESRRGNIPLDAISSQWTQLLLTSLAAKPERQHDSRLEKLAMLVEPALDFPWTVEEMAQCIGLSASRLHALFQDELATPRRNGWRGCVYPRPGTGWPLRISP